MTHEEAVVLSQIVSLAIFGSAFLAALAYVFWPANKRKFSEAAYLPLALDASAKPQGDAS